MTSQAAERPISPALRTWASYALALALAAAAALLRWALDPLLGETQPFPTFYVAVLLLTLWKGWRPALLCALLGFLLGDWFFLAPRQSLSIVTLDALAHTVIYFLVSAALIYVIHRSQMYSRALAAANLSLRQSQERLRATFDKAAVGIVEVDTQGRFLAANEQVCQVLGYTLEELQAKTIHEITAPEDHLLSDRLNADLVAGRSERLDYEKRYVKRDGSPLWVHVTATAIRDAAGGPSRFIGTMEDITQRKQAENALREQAHLAHFRADAIQALQQPGPIQALFHQAAVLLVERLDAAFARVWTLDTAGQTLELQASAGLYTHLNGPHSRVPVGQLKIGRIAQERRPLVTNQVIGDPNIPNQDWARREGLLAFAGFPLLLEGRLLGVVALFARHPLSPAAIETFAVVAGTLAQALGRHTAEEALRAAREALLRANADLDSKVQQRTASLQDMIAELEHMSYSMVHDMRGPLRAIQSFGAMLQEDPETDLSAKGRNLLVRMRTAAQRMDQLLIDALDYSRAVRVQLPVGPVNVRQLLLDLLAAHLEFQPPRSEVTLVGEFPWVMAHEAGLAQCFAELLRNAVKFVPPGTLPRVTVGTQPIPPSELPHAEMIATAAAKDSADAPSGAAQAWVRLWIEDNGTGIPQNGQQRIFDMFQRMHGPEYPGTGIGLALVRKVIARMGGRIGVQSQQGKGSRFWLDLPLGGPS